ncbi:hypothetical protein KQH22_30905, partial [Streptomyces sp. Vc714c-19]|uniref:hypothetical protein n=1 Tax=Streptomyces sp. Vc714c-19 TaxID=2841673 RepID=UPI0035A98A03|nr:hypothetical protein [Streptomyces sp. Vc714c-19]
MIVRRTRHPDAEPGSASGPDAESGAESEVNSGVNLGVDSSVDSGTESDVNDVDDVSPGLDSDSDAASSPRSGAGDRDDDAGPKA